VRRVVVKAGPDGRSSVASDEELHEQGFLTMIWEGDAAPIVPGDGSPPSTSGGFFPPPGGWRVVLFRLLPQHVAARDGLAAEPSPEAARIATMAPAMRSRRGDPLDLHEVDTIAHGLVVSGEIVMILDEQEVHLRAGDWYVQPGTQHGWRVVGDQPCVIAGFMVGATRAAAPSYTPVS
jgi:mannose-6-phosphate isomerase-like protein (cupin superfamily)